MGRLTATTPEHICIMAALCMLSSELGDEKLPGKNPTEEEVLCSAKCKRR